MTVSLCNIHWRSFLNSRLFFTNTELDFMWFFWFMKSLSLKTLVQLDCTFASLRERSLLRCKTLDQCLCLGAYFATIFQFCFSGVVFCTCGPFFCFWFLVSPHPVFAFQLVLVNRRRSQTQILWRLLWNGLEGFTRSLAALGKVC